MFGFVARQNSYQMLVLRRVLRRKYPENRCYSFSSFYKCLFHSHLDPMDVNIKTHVSESNRPFTVFIEGNIGSGKTTFLSYFNGHHVKLLSEPTDIWRNVRGHNILDMMYKDPGRWAFTFQSLVQKTMLELHVKHTDCPVKLMERSIYSARYCFVENLHQEGLMSSPEYAVIDEWFKWIITNTKISADLIIYLKTEPEIVYQRIKNRGRAEESSLMLEYLTKLHHLHEDWLINKKVFSRPCPVVVLDANKELSEVIKEFQDNYETEILNEILLKQKSRLYDNATDPASPNKIRQLLFGSPAERDKFISTNRLNL